MKYFSSVIVLLSLLSCNKKYEGNWTSDYFKETIETPKSIVINKDSILFNYWAFNHYHKYPLKIQRDELWFNGWRVKAEILDDTLSLNNINYYIKHENDSILKRWFGNPIVNIKLSENLVGLYNKKIFSNENLRIYYLFYGKRIDNNEFNLQLNDRYADINDIPEFLSIGHEKRHQNFPISILFIDEYTKLNDVEKLFREHQKVNSLKIELINNINLSYLDSLGFYYEYESLSKKLPPIFENDNYSPNKSSEQISPPPPYLSPPLFEDDSSNISYFILKDNSFFHNKIRIDDSEFSLQVEKAIIDSNIIISLFDLKSNYKSFLKMNGIINGVYNKKRNDLALKKFNKNFSELDNEQGSEIIIEIMMKHIWSYSLPHYQHLTNKDNYFFGLKVKPIDSLLPD